MGFGARMMPGVFFSRDQGLSRSPPKPPSRGPDASSKYLIFGKPLEFSVKLDLKNPKDGYQYFQPNNPKILAQIPNWNVNSAFGERKNR